MMLTNRIQFKFAWYDMWIGVFYDRDYKIISICPLPMFLFVIYPKYESWSPSTSIDPGME